MRHRNIYCVLSALAFALPLMSGAALAGDRISSTIVEAASHAGDFHLTKPGNSLTIAPAPASAPAGTLAVMTLKLKNVDCVAEGNDKGVTGKCGVAGTGMDAVLDIVIHNTTSGDVRVGIPIEFEKGRATFVATGTNKIDAAAANLTSVLASGAPVSFDAINIREEGSNPTDCATIPLPPVNGCVDGNEFAFTGIRLGP